MCIHPPFTQQPQGGQAQCIHYGVRHPWMCPLVDALALIHPAFENRHMRAFGMLLRRRSPGVNRITAT